MTSVCGLSISGIASSNPAEGKNVRRRRFLCRHRPLRQADLSFREAIPRVYVFVRAYAWIFV